MAKWAKGESGNPGGRPKGLGDIREIARAHTATAIDTLVSVLEDAKANPSARVSAANALLDRGWGRPAQTLRATIDSEEGKIDAALGVEASRLVELIRGSENTRESAPEAPSPVAETPSNTH